MNLGDVDRSIRIVVGLALLLLCFFGPETHWGLLGLLPLATGLTGESPLYRALGISTLHQRDGST